MTALAAAALAACGLDDATSLPQPQPIPGLVRRSTPAMTIPDAPQTLVLGLVGAVPGLGAVELRRQQDGAKASGRSSDQGSFSLVIGAGKGDVLELRFSDAHGTSEPLVLHGVLAVRGPFLGPPEQTFGGPVSAPDANGIVTVSNDSGTPTPHFTATPSSELLVANETNGAVAAGTTDGTGLFSLTLPGASGDAVRVLLAAAGNPGATSDFLTFKVP